MIAEDKRFMANLSVLIQMNEFIQKKSKLPVVDYLILPSRDLDKMCNH